MKIDLHCHTRKIKKGDGDGREVSPELFRKKIIDADVKIVAITNHNTFDYEQYQLLGETVGDICQIWPGIEIDIKDRGNKWHLIVVVNPEQVGMFNQKVQELFKDDDLETCTHTLDETYGAFSCCDAIYISHFHKEPAITEEDREKLMRLVGDRARVFHETSDRRSMGVFANYDYNMLVGSDVKNWAEYEKCSFADLRLPVDSFSQFCLLAKRDISVVDSLINRKQPYELIASPHSSVHFKLRIYPDINILFGPKGTGKTEILKSLYDAMLQMGLKSVMSVASERAEEFGSLLGISDMKRDLSILQREACSREFESLKSWKDIGPTQFVRYMQWYTTKDNNRNKSRMMITNAQTIPYIKPLDYDLHRDDLSYAHQGIQLICSINMKEYLAEDECISIKHALNKLLDSICQARRSDLQEEEAIHLSNYTIDKIKSIADKNSDTVSKPSSTGFKEYAIARLGLLKAINTILYNLREGEENEQIRLGELEDKGAIFINRKYRMLCALSRTAEFSVGIRTLKDIVSKLEEIKQHIFDNDIATLLDAMLQVCDEANIDNINSFLGMSKQIVTSDGKEYTPSNGEKGILLLQKTLSSEADAYFLDEPELGMGNSYIDMNIRPILSSLAKQRKCVVVATHNANIAVRTLPYMSVYRTHSNGKYRTYVGNPFNDRLVNIEDEDDCKSWTMESMHSLEGGREAFYERKSIYESKGD